jgi:hypothetical protein
VARPTDRIARAAAVLACAAAMALPVPATAAFDFSGTRSVFAVTADGQRRLIGRVDFAPADGGASTFRLSLDADAFTDHFLSMREFKCLPGAREISCHVPYPYENPSRVSAGSLAWLEHALLFMHKSPAEFGARLWNGVYYEFRDDGARLVGQPTAVDLNEIAAPPANRAVPPFGPARRHPMPADARWLRQLVIE